MTRVDISPERIRMDGHAGSKIACAMITSQAVGLLTNLENHFGFKINGKLEPGFFYLDTKDLPIEGQILVHAFCYSMLGIAGSYPKYVQVVSCVMPPVPYVNKS